MTALRALFVHLLFAFFTFPLILFCMCRACGWLGRNAFVLNGVSAFRYKYSSLRMNRLFVFFSVWTWLYCQLYDGYFIGRGWSYIVHLVTTWRLQKPVADDWYNSSLFSSSFFILSLADPGEVRWVRTKPLEHPVTGSKHKKVNVKIMLS